MSDQHEIDHLRDLLKAKEIVIQEQKVLLEQAHSIIQAQSDRFHEHLSKCTRDTLPAM